MHNKTKTNTEPQQTIGSALNNRSTTTEPPHLNGQQPEPQGLHFTGAKPSPWILLLLNHDTRILQIHSSQQEHIQSQATNCSHVYIRLASTRENLSSVFANNKGEDQPAHPRSLISAFVIRLSENIISKIATREILIFQLVSVA